MSSATPAPDRTGPDPVDPPSTPDEIAAQRIARLERRLERERTARLEAERIAEDGMRALWSANQELEQRVAERTESLERSLLAANAASATRERFLAELGHDLATPLHNVLGLLELVDVESLSDVDRNRLSDATAHASRLAELLRGLVDLAGAEAASAPHDIVEGDGRTWLDTVVADWSRPLARRAQLLVPSVRNGEKAVRADWGRLRRIVDAALSNVVVHADSGPVEVSLGVDEERTIVLTVTDSGPGLPTEVETTATDPFVSAGPSAGTGLGLAIADRVARGAGGELVVGAGTAGAAVRATIPIG